MDCTKFATHLTALTGREWVYEAASEPTVEDDEISCTGTGWHIQVDSVGGTGIMTLNFWNEGKSDDDCWLRVFTRPITNTTEMLNLVHGLLKGKTDLQLHELGHCGEFIK